uniref:PB1 domain-containing protein n=1 Tax=Onchocerca volvulus TaxID=6282 RepID=A0A8R1Y5S9_ONCVO
MSSIDVKMLFLTLLTFSFVHAFYDYDRITGRPISSSSHSQQNEVEVKWNYYGKIRRFTVRSESCCIYDELKKTLHSYEPAFKGVLVWKDDENDLVLLNSSNELSVAMKYKPDKFLRLNTTEWKIAIFGLSSLHREMIFVKQLPENPNN